MCVDRLLYFTSVCHPHFFQTGPVPFTTSIVFRNGLFALAPPTMSGSGLLIRPHLAESRTCVWGAGHLNDSFLSAHGHHAYTTIINVEMR